MGDVSAEPSMEDILSSIKRIIAEEGEGAPANRARRTVRTQSATVPGESDRDDEVLELRDPVDTPAETPSAETILSERVAEASRGQLDALSRMIVRPETAGSDTLEGLVREMLRPMLREWLDANLPAVVERLVAREIARISSQPS